MSGQRGIRGEIGALDYQPVIDWVDDRIVNSPGSVVLVFLVVTGLFVLGLGNVSSEAGTQQFTTGLPSEEALEDIQTDFSPTFEPDTGGTTLIQRSQNVLSKPELLRMLELQQRIDGRAGLRVTGTASAAQLIAQQLDPGAETLQEKIRTIEDATPSEIDTAVQSLADSSRFTGTLSNDFNRRSASASATIGSVTHEVPSGISQGAGQGGSSPLTPIQQRIQFIASSVTGDFTVFGNGIFSEENSAVIGDSLAIVVPAAVVLIFFFLIFAYRDLLDLLLGLAALVMAIIWTFGFLGLAGIPFSPLLISVPPLLLAVGVDFGIHAINRYREERVEGAGIESAMRVTTDQLVVAFFIVTGTTVLGFLANLTSALPPTRDFGLIAAVGIVFTFLIFGIFLPAAKVGLDRLRARFPIPTFSTRPLGSEGSILSSVLRVGVVIAKRAPAIFLIVVLITTAGAGVYATGIDTSFTQEQFLPPEDVPDRLYDLPEPFRPNRYTVTATLNFLEDRFVASQQGSVTVLLETSMTRDSALESIQRASEDPPDSFVRQGDQADYQSIISVIQSRAETDPEFRRLVARNDVDGDGVPDDNLRDIYEALLDSPARQDALSYLSEDFQSARLVYSVEADSENSEVEQDARVLATRFRDRATPTGLTVVFQAVSDLIFASAVTSLAVALSAAVLFLVLIYAVLLGRGSLGVANTVPIVVSVAAVGAAMRALGVPFNAVTATIFAITIGLGIDYSVHIVHRYADEREERPMLPALDRTVQGTGGALLGSMLTTTFGIGVLVLALFPILQQFGLITALAIFFSFLASLIVLPSVLVIWDHLIIGERTIAPLFGIGRQPWRETVAVAAAGDEPRLTTSDAVTDQAPIAPDDTPGGSQVGPDEEQSSDDDAVAGSWADLVEEQPSDDDDDTATGGGGADTEADDSDESDG
jgi:hydrophobe/amphiphile efflux-3 (HAE3) family protein